MIYLFKTEKPKQRHTNKKNQHPVASLPPLTLREPIVYHSYGGGFPVSGSIFNAGGFCFTMIFSTFIIIVI